MKMNVTTGNVHFYGVVDNCVNVFYIGQGLKDLIISLVVVIRIEVERHKKLFDVTNEQLVEKVLGCIEERKSNFTNAKGSLKYYEALTREVVWNYANAREAKYIISRLKSGDALFAYKFFYGTNNNGCNISRFRSKIIAQIKQSYHYELSIEEFGNIVYTYLWNKGTWSVLDNYAQKSSFFCWLEQVARHEVMRVLEEMKVIHVNRERTVSNTRLIGPSVLPEVWDFIISDLISEGLYKNLLVASYVDCLNEEEMMKEFNLDIDTLRMEVKKAELMMKDKLIRGNVYYENLVLRDKTPRNMEVSAEFIKDFVKWQEEKSDVNSLADVFGVNLSKEEVHEKVVDFLYHFSEKLQWSDEDKLIWRLRFIENIAPMKVAERCGKTRTWLDTRYSRLNKKFCIAIRKWWKANA